MELTLVDHSLVGSETVAVAHDDAQELVDDLSLERVEESVEFAFDTDLAVNWA